MDGLTLLWSLQSGIILTIFFFLFPFIRLPVTFSYFGFLNNLKSLQNSQSLFIHKQELGQNVAYRLWGEVWRGFVFLIIFFLKLFTVYRDLWNYFKIKLYSCFSGTERILCCKNWEAEQTTKVDKVLVFFGRVLNMFWPNLDRITPFL